MTLRELDNVISVYSDQEKVRMQESWEQARFIAFTCVSPYAKRGMRITDLLSFEWDKIKQIDFETIRERARRLHGLSTQKKRARGANTEGT